MCHVWPGFAGQACVRLPRTDQDHNCREKQRIPHAVGNETFVWHALTNGKGVVDRRPATPFAKPQGRATPPATSFPPDASLSTARGIVRALRVEFSIRQRSKNTLTLRPRMSVPKRHACPAKPGQAWHTTPNSSAVSGICQTSFGHALRKATWRATRPSGRRHSRLANINACVTRAVRNVRVGELDGRRGHAARGGRADKTTSGEPVRWRAGLTGGVLPANRPDGKH
jgi:hypothetical protein